jgi:hypothetical protein
MGLKRKIQAAALEVKYRLLMVWFIGVCRKPFHGYVIRGGTAETGLRITTGGALPLRQRDRDTFIAFMHQDNHMLSHISVQVGDGDIHEILIDAAAAQP